ncbi:MAG: ATP-binding protein, partial [Synergistaceae bacterium]|nr:ATP-binding protein [Synergistaceae bacterium]
MSGLGIREQIFRNNPFFSGIASDPWDNSDPDVPSLNQEAYRHLCELVLAKSRNPNGALAGLVLGETGMGKTHLLKRLLRYIRRNGIETVFVSVHPLRDPLRPMRHLLREIALDLSGKGVYEGRRTKPLTRRRVTQFDYLIDKIMTACRKDERDSEPRTGIARLFFSLFSRFSRVSGGADPESGIAFL